MSISGHFARPEELSVAMHLRKVRAKQHSRFVREPGLCDEPAWSYRGGFQDRHLVPWTTSVGALF